MLMSDIKFIFSEADEKTIRDTVNKQRRLIELYNMQRAMGNSQISSSQLQHIVSSSKAISSLIIENATGHHAATLKAATSLMGAMMVAQMGAQQLDDAAAIAASLADKTQTSTPAKAAPQKAATPAKKV
jgi:hypothetical protein